MNKSVFRNFTKFIGKHLRQSISCKKPKACNFIKNETLLLKTNAVYVFLTKTHGTINKTYRFCSIIEICILGVQPNSHTIWFKT